MKAQLHLYEYKPVTSVIKHMKKLLDSDWLRAVQIKCNISAKSVTLVEKSVTTVQITHRNSVL